VKLYEQGGVPSERFRDLGMAFRTLLDYLRDEREVATSARLDELEERVEKILSDRGLRIAK
jgi:hypothetical protein